MSERHGSQNTGQFVHIIIKELFDINIRNRGHFLLSQEIL